MIQSFYEMTTKETKRKIVQLNVGGTRYDVSRDTLERCEGSMLASLISDHWKEGNSDDDKPIFIDRNGLLFQYVLDYLRTRKVFVPPSVSRAAVKEEFQYYGIDAGTGCDTAFVELDVGGTPYKVGRDTLLRRTGSKLSTLVSEHMKKGNSDISEPIFIDRNGRLFEYVLDYLRTGKLNLPPSVNHAAVKEEFWFYGLPTSAFVVMRHDTFVEEMAHKFSGELQSALNKVSGNLQSELKMMHAVFENIDDDVCGMRNELRKR